MALLPRRSAVVASFALALFAGFVLPATGAQASNSGSTVPTLTGPVSNTTTPLKDVVLTWDAVAGAAEYQVQLSPNGEFTNNTVTLPNSGDTVNTLYELPISLPHATYFWRVRAQVGGTWGSYSSAREFLREWQSDFTVLKAPTSADPTITWTPVPDASEYLVRFSTESDFPTDDTKTFNCYTNQTSFTPYKLDSSKENATAGCFSEADLTSGTTYYWELEAFDDSTAPAVVADTTNEPDYDCAQAQPECDAVRPVSSFTFVAPAAGTLASPSTVTGLTTSWHTTTSASTTCDVTTPCPITPTFSWNPVPGANYYSVHVFRDEDGTNTYRAYDTAWPELTPRDSFFDATAGTPYYWVVQAGTCQNSDTDPTCAATGGSGTSTTMAAGCTAGTGTSDPTLSTGADGLTVSQAGPNGAQSMLGGTTATITLTGTNLMSGLCIAASVGTASGATVVSSSKVTFSYHAPQAGGTVTFQAINADGSASNSSVDLTVLPSANIVTGGASIEASFAKASGPVQQTSPGDGAVEHGRSVTFKWDDYEANGSQGSYDARNYELQVSTSSSFNTTVIDDKNIDLTQYTDPQAALADGTYFWRVAAIDESGNELTWSDTRSVTVNAVQPTVSLVVPKKGVAVTGPLTIHLSEAISGVNAKSVKVIPASGAPTAVAGKLTLGSSPTVYEFTPTTPLATGQTYELRLSDSLVDANGNPAVVGGTGVRTKTAARNTSKGWTYSNGWTKHTASGARSGSYRSAAAGQTASIEVAGSKATLYACKGPSMGSVTVTVGGKSHVVSEKQSFTRCGVAVWSAAISQKTEKLTVRVSKGNGNLDEVAVK